MNDPDSVEIDEEVTEGTFFIVCLEEGPVPIDSVEFREPLRWWEVDETQLETC